MKKIISVFIICLLALGLVACEKGGKSGKELEVAHLDQDKLGLYYGASDATCEVKESAVVFQDKEFTVYTSGDANYVIKFGDEETQISVKFEGAKITIGDLGTFTKRVKANVKEEKQGVYASQEDLTKTTILRADSIKVEGKEYTLFEDATGVYYVADDKEVYLTFSSVLTVATVVVNGKTYVITNMPLPAEDGELTKLVKKIVEKIQNTAFSDFALEATATAETKQTITKGEKDPSKIDLIGAILGDLKLTANASVNIKDVDLEDLTKLLALVTAHIELQVAGETNEINVQANVQDGLLLAKQWGKDPEEAEYSCEQLPEKVELSDVPLEALSGVDLDGLYTKLAEIEAQLAQFGVTYADVQTLLSKVFSLTEKEIKINITKSDAIAVLAGVKLLANSKLDAALSVAWDEMSEEDKAEYNNNASSFKDAMVTKINEALAEAEAFVNSLTINSCKLELNFETFAGLIDIDVVIPGQDTVKGEDEQETVVCEYNTAIKAHLEIRSVEVKDVAKVNPEDYIIDLDDIKAEIAKYFANVTLPALSENAEFDLRKENGDDRTYVNVYFESLTEDEAKAIVSAFANISNNTSEDGLSTYYRKATAQTITNCEVYAYEQYDAAGSVKGYRLSVVIEIRANDLPSVQVNVGEGITIEFELEENGVVWFEDSLRGTATWTDESKVLYVKQNNQIIGIVHDSGDSLYLACEENSAVSFELGEEDQDLIQIYISSTYFAKALGAAYAHKGDTVTYTVSFAENYTGDVTTLDLYDMDGSTVLQSNLTDGDTFTYTVPEDASYVFLYLNEHRDGIGE